MADIPTSHEGSVIRAGQTAKPADAQPSGRELSRRNFLLGRLIPGNSGRQNLEQAARVQLDQAQDSARAEIPGQQVLPNPDSTGERGDLTGPVKLDETGGAQGPGGLQTGATEAKLSQEDALPPAGTGQGEGNAGEGGNAGKEEGKAAAEVTDPGKAEKGTATEAGRDDEDPNKRLAGASQLPATDKWGNPVAPFNRRAYELKDYQFPTTEAVETPSDNATPGETQEKKATPPAAEQDRKERPYWKAISKINENLKEIERKNPATGERETRFINEIGVDVTDDIKAKQEEERKAQEKVPFRERLQNVLNKLKPEDRESVANLVKEQQETIGKLTSQTEALTTQITSLVETVSRLEQRLGGAQVTGEAQTDAAAGDGQSVQADGEQQSATEAEQPAPVVAETADDSVSPPGAPGGPASEGGVVTTEQTAATAPEPAAGTIVGPEAPAAQNMRAEAARNRELLRTQDKEAIGALNYTYEYVKGLFENGKLAPAELWLFESVRAAMDSVDKKGNKYTFTNNIDASRKITQEEGIPVEGLFEIINERAQAGQIPEAARDKLFKQMSILAGNSYRYVDIAGRLPDENPQVFQARLQQEITYIRGNPIRRNQGESGNHELAERTLLGRAEFIPPSKRAARVVSLPSAAAQPAA